MMQQSHLRQPYTLDRTVRLIITIAVIAGLIFIVNYLKDVLLPFILACVIAYIIHPFVVYNKQLFRLQKESVAVFITLAELVSIITFVSLFLFPYLISEIGLMAGMLSKYTSDYVSNPYMPDAVHDFIVKYLDGEKLSTMVTPQEMLRLAEHALSELWVIMGSSIKVLFTVISWFIVILYIIFILLDYNRIMNGFKNMIPPRYSKEVMNIVSDIESVMNHYFRGQALVAFIVGIMFSIGFLIIGFPMPVVFGLFIGVLNIVPYLQLISIPIAAVLGVVMAVSTGVNFWIIVLEVTAVYCVVQIIQDMVLTPRIMGKYMGLNPAIIFLSLSVWGTLFGFLGFLIALPLTTLLISYYKEYVLKRGKTDTDENKGTLISSSKDQKK